MPRKIRAMLKRYGVLLPFVLLALALVVGPARADADSESRATVEAQLDAMAAGDFEAAYGFAAPGVKEKFPSPEIFEHMVRKGYPMVVAPQMRSFLGTERQAGLLVQRVRLVDRQGQAYVARYFMKQIDGAWRIAAVSIEKAEDLAV